MTTPTERRRPIEDRLRDAGLPPLPRTAWLEIDLDALLSNLAAIRAAVGDGVRVEPVVKADAYGHGLVPVSRTLAAAGADGLSVATFDEAVVLRDAGLRCPILVLYPVPPAFTEAAGRRRISLSVGDSVLLERLLASARGRRQGRGALGLQIELETGLGRGGFEPAAAAQAAALIQRTQGARLDGVWSHLAAPSMADRSGSQRQAFEVGLAALAAEGMRVPIRHLAASGAVLTGSAPVYEAVRPGLAIYGLVPDDLIGRRLPLAAALRPVMALLARPVRVADLPPGHGVSYGPSFTTARPSRIATLPIGYADGWPRALSNRAAVIVRGLRVPLVGTVAMDAVMADVTDVPGPPVDLDDEFTLIGAQGAERVDVAELARLRTTISWEVVAGMARRLPRVYHAAAELVGIRTLNAAEDRWPESSSGTAISATSKSTPS
ncbi:MAG: alanine racemase [Solirubrobacterales bacterium]